MKPTFKEARKVMVKGLDEPGLRTAYRCQIACVLMDNVPGYKRNHDKRDILAEKILSAIFVK